MTKKNPRTIETTSRPLKDNTRTTQGQIKDKSKTTRGQPKDNSWTTHGQLMDNSWAIQKQSKHSEKRKITNLPKANLYDSVISYQARSPLKLKSAFARITHSSVG